MVDMEKHLSETSRNMKIIRDLDFVEDSYLSKQSFDLYLPDDPLPGPLLVYVHGGEADRCAKQI